LSGLVSVGFFALDWNSEQSNSASIQPWFKKGTLRIGLLPQEGKLENPHYTLSLRLD